MRFVDQYLDFEVGEKRALGFGPFCLVHFVARRFLKGAQSLEALTSATGYAVKNGRCIWALLARGKLFAS